MPTDSAFVPELDDLIVDVATPGQVPTKQVDGTWAAQSVAGGNGSGDMTKAVYDTDNDGVVDAAEVAAVAAAVPWAGVTDKPIDFPPSAHNHDDRYYTESEADALLANKLNANDASVTNSRPPTGGAGGVLSGEYPNPGFAVNMATQDELDAHTTNTSNPHGTTKAQVGLANVDNTSDTNKPVSTAQQTALDLKLNANDPSVTNARTPTAHVHSGTDITSGTVAIERIPTGQTGTTVALGNDARFSDARTPTLHNHAAGDISSGTFDVARIPTGQTATTVPLGNDARFSDARTPTAHTHAASEVTTGQFAIARLASGTPDGTKFVRDDGVLATPSGGGSSLAPARPKTGTTYGWGLPGVEFAAVQTGSIIAARQYYVPFELAAAINLEQMAVEVTSGAGAGQVMRMGIYKADMDWQPTDLVIDAGTVLIDSVGVKTLTTALSLAAGRHLTTFVAVSAPTLRIFRSTSRLLGMVNALGTTPFHRWMYLAGQTTGALPASGAGRAWTTVETDSAGTFNPIVLKWS